MNNNEGNVNKVSSKELREFLKHPSRRNLSPHKAIIQRIFKSDIDDYLGDNNERHRSLVESVFSLALDPGLIRSHEFNGTIQDGTALLNRQSLLYELRQRVNLREHEDGLQHNFDKEFKILKLDLQNFRKADELDAGDYDLNIFGKRLGEIISEIAEEIQIDPNNLIAGRYGGDEFCIGVINDPDNVIFKRIKDIKQKILTKISSTRGYFSDSEKTEQFTLKNNEVEEISIPDIKDKNGRLIYLSFLERGLVLDAEQIEIEKKYFEKSPIVSLQEYLKEALAKSIYPKPIEIINDQDEKISAKVEYLTKIHSELRIPFFLAQVLDKNNPSERNKRTVKMLNFIENYLVDPLLDEVIMSRFDIIDHIQNGEFTSIFTYEIKLKEIDDHLSYVYGDEVLINFWKNNLKNDLLKKAIDQGRVKIGRVGGAIIIGEVKGKNGKGSLSKKEESYLTSFSHTPIQFENTIINHEVGYSKIAIPSREISDTEAKKLFSKCFIESTDDWLDKTFSRLFETENEKKLEQFLFQIDNFDELDNKTVTDKLTLISAKYFTGNRWDKRIDNGLKSLKPTHNKQMNEKKDRIAKAFKKVVTKKLAQEKAI